MRIRLISLCLFSFLKSQRIFVTVSLLFRTFAKTKQMILDVIREVEEGKVYTGKITKVEDFGCFVELWPGCEGLVHVSQLAWERVEKPSDVGLKAAPI